MATYTVPERIERDGILVAFEGQVITEEEADKLGILPKPAPKKRTAKKPEAEAEEA